MNNTPPDIDIEFQDEFTYQDYIHRLPDDISDEKLVELDREVRELETDYISEALAQGLF